MFATTFLLPRHVKGGHALTTSHGVCAGPTSSAFAAAGMAVYALMRPRRHRVRAPGTRGPDRLDPRPSPACGLRATAPRPAAARRPLRPTACRGGGRRQRQVRLAHAADRDISGAADHLRPRPSGPPSATGPRTGGARATAQGREGAVARRAGPVVQRGLAQPRGGVGADGRLGGGGVLSGLDATTGKLLWRIKIPARGSRSTARCSRGRRPRVGSRRRAAAVVDLTTGKIRWSARARHAGADRHAVPPDRDPGARVYYLAAAALRVRRQRRGPYVVGAPDARCTPPSRSVPGTSCCSTAGGRVTRTGSVRST